MLTYIPSYIDLYIYIYIRIYIHPYIYPYMHTYILHTHINAHTYVHTYIHTSCVRTYTHAVKEQINSSIKGEEKMTRKEKKHLHDVTHSLRNLCEKGICILCFTLPRFLLYLFSFLTVRSGY